MAAGSGNGRSDAPARAIPVGFHHAPGTAKLSARLKDDPEAIAAHKTQRKQNSLTAQTLDHLTRLRARVPATRVLHLVGDGSYTNATILRKLPADTLYTGRFRKDAVLHYEPDVPAAGKKGRRPPYGERAPTPDALRADDTRPWQTVRAHATGQEHDFRIKVLDNVLWRKTGATRRLRVIVIAPLGYRMRAGSRLLYRQPAYLLSTATTESVAELLQIYLWRWGIEVNFRDEKTLIGTGDAQVRGPAANEHLPAMTVAAYSHLWQAALQLAGEGESLTLLEPPRWRRPSAERQLPTSGDLLRLLRSEYWAETLKTPYSSHFAAAPPPVTTAEKFTPDLAAALLAVA